MIKFPVLVSDGIIRKYSSFGNDDQFIPAI